MKLLKRKQILKGNPPQYGVAPGVGRTVSPDFKFKFLDDLKYYWLQEIGRTSKNIHTHKPNVYMRKEVVKQFDTSRAKRLTGKTITSI